MIRSNGRILKRELFISCINTIFSRNTLQYIYLFTVRVADEHFATSRMEQYEVCTVKRPVPAKPRSLTWKQIQTHLQFAIQIKVSRVYLQQLTVR